MHEFSRGDGEKCRMPRRKKRKYYSAICRLRDAALFVFELHHAESACGCGFRVLSDTAGTYRDDGIIKARRNPEMMKM